MSMSPVEHPEFTEFLLAKAREAEAKLRYRPTQFLQMLNSGGGYATAVQLLSSRSISEGFKTLWAKKRLDLTVEALVLENKWGSHFDPVLREVATKRLRDAGYQPKIYKSPSRGVTAPALDVALSIEWDDTIEVVPLQLDLLQRGTRLQTVDTWKDGTEPTTYDTECVAIRASSGGWDINLFYDRRHGTNRDVARAYPDADWGTSKLHLDRDLSGATAVFHPDDGSPPGKGVCTVMRTGLYAELSRAQINVLLRPRQAALRNDLIRRFGRCAISNECAEDALEAAHIIGHSAAGGATVHNAILLRADLHALFDAGRLRIDLDGNVRLVGVAEGSRYHAELASTWNRRLPTDVLALVSPAIAERHESARRGGRT